jgi:hypothetical protein
MGGTNPTAAVLEGAKKALDNARNFTHSVTGGKPNAFAPKPKAEAKPEPSDYSHARAQRPGGKEFLGVRSNEAPDINIALRNREDAKKALEQ